MFSIGESKARRRRLRCTEREATFFKQRLKFSQFRQAGFAYLGCILYMQLPEPRVTLAQALENLGSLLEYAVAKSNALEQVAKFSS